MWVWILAGLWAASWLCIPHLLLLNKRPTATLAWLWAIFLFPVVGAALYLAIGSERVARRRQERGEDFRAQGDRIGVHALVSRAASPLIEKLSADDRLLLRGFVGHYPITPATASSVDVLYKGAPYYGGFAPRRSKRLKRRSKWSRSSGATTKWGGVSGPAHRDGAARRGGAVLVDEARLLYLHDSHFRPLVEAGGEFSWCHTSRPCAIATLQPAQSSQAADHRRRIAFVGGMNFGREYHRAATR